MLKTGLAFVKEGIVPLTTSAQRKAQASAYAEQYRIWQERWEKLQAFIEERQKAQ